MAKHDDAKTQLYFHLNPNTHKVFYVGIGNGRRPFHTIQRSEYWKRYVSKHGAPIIKIVRSGLTWEAAQELEKKYIKLLGRTSCVASGRLVNMTDGGDGMLGRKLSDKAKEVLRKANIGRVKSTESRAKMSRSKTGLSFPKPSIQQAVDLYDRTGTLVKSYKKIGDVKADGFNPLMASRIAKLKAWRTSTRMFFVHPSDAVCPAYMSIRVEIANSKKKFRPQAIENIRAGVSNRKPREYHGVYA